jgi:hypothetical protein
VELRRRGMKFSPSAEVWLGRRSEGPKGGKVAHRQDLNASVNDSGRRKLALGASIVNK